LRDAISHRQRYGRRGSKPVVYISAMSIGFTESQSFKKIAPNIAVMQGSIARRRG